MRLSIKRVIILTFVLIGIIAVSYGQSTEISIQAGSGLFSFGGESATKTSFINVSDVASIPSYTNNPYGKYNGFSYGFGAQIQHMTKSAFIFGLQICYESLSSKVKIDGVSGPFGTWSVVEGKTILTSNFININPFIGKRFELLGNINTDFKFGFDFAACLSSKEKFDIALSPGNNITGSMDRSKPNLDFRPRIEMVNYYKKVGLSIGYSYGLTNYTPEMDGANMENQARYFRLGLSYIIK